MSRSRPGAGTLAFLALLQGACANPPSVAHEDSAIAVGAEVQVNPASPRRPHAEYMADADPAHPGRMIACDFTFDGLHNNQRVAAYFSADDGKSWRQTKDATGFRDGTLGAGDPACGYGVNGVAFLIGLVSGPPDEFRGNAMYEDWTKTKGTRIYRSPDGGATWPDSTEVGFLDNENLLVDQTGGPFQGRVYLYGNWADWTKARDWKIWLTYSTDTGRTWLQSAATTVGRSWAQMDRGTVHPDGTLILPFAHLDSLEHMAVALSTDGGAHLTKPRAGPAFSTGNFECWAPPQLTSDNSDGPFRGRIYLTWIQATKILRGPFADICTVMIAYSDDKGQSWSPNIQVSDALPRLASEAPPNAWLTTIAINKNGVVGISWYDSREDPRSFTRRLRFSASLDGGETWLSSVPVAAQTLVTEGERGAIAWAGTNGGGIRGMLMQNQHVLHTSINEASHGADGGDYSALVPDSAGIFHAFWVDNRSAAGTPPQLYTAPVRVRGDVAPNGSRELAALQDVTPLVEVNNNAVKTEWAGNTATITISYILINTSKDTIVGPVKVRVYGLRSVVGPAKFLPGQGCDGGTQCILDFTDALPNGRLAPGQETAARPVRVLLGPVHPTASYLSLADLDARVFGKVASRIR